MGFCRTCRDEGSVRTWFRARHLFVARKGTIALGAVCWMGVGADAAAEAARGMQKVKRA
jgi:hypothetical protein